MLILLFLDSACMGAELIIENNSTFQCNDTVTGALFPSFAVNEPSFSYDFGDCTFYESQPNTNNYNQEDYNDTTHTYNSPGIYYVQLSAVNFCNENIFEDTVIIFPSPNVSFYANSAVCLYDTTSFTTDVFASPSTTDTLSCGLVIDVPAGDTTFSYQWSMDEGTDGNYVNGTNAYSSNPYFVFNSCGDHNVSLTITDGNNCITTFDTTITIWQLPNALFSAPSVCEGTRTCINDASSFNTIDTCYGAPITNWEYLLFDVTQQTYIDILNYDLSDSDADSCYLFTTGCDSTITGYSYEITLNIIDSNLCSNSYLNITTIICSPDADFDNS